MASESSGGSAKSTIDEPSAAKIVARLRNLRVQRQWTQAELAERADVSLATMTNIETGRTSLTVQHLYRFAVAFSVPPATLLADEQPPAAPESELLDAVRRHDRDAALAALARALGLPPTELIPLPNPSSPSYTPAHVADLGRNAARLARSAARLVGDAEGADPARLLAEWTEGEA